ncbi:MAG: PIG-L deacetylase family protein, partial [Acidimicrobiales bacterium]
MPAELVADAPTRALAIYAHPDDAEVSCGGTLARWSAAGCEVEVVVCTRGDKGSTDPAVDV